MQLKLLVLLNCISFGALKHHPIKLDEEGRKCADDHKIHDDFIAIFESGNGSMPVDHDHLQRFTTCRYGKHYDDNHKLIMSEEAVDDCTSYYSGLMKGKLKLARVLARQALYDCQDNEDEIRGAAVLKVINCLTKEFHDYDVVC